ncbi:MAG TPA: hypothetical protein VFA89_04025 [Terriglobales bacterium]|nr:hypothetical protein [Terriglobales bacterium]
MTGRVISLCVLAVGLTLSSVPTSAEPQYPSQSRAVEASSAPAHPLNTRQSTWYEFLLKQFNPHDIDYGQWLEHERQAFLEARLRNPYFAYCAATTLALLAMGIVCAKLRIDHRRAMWITAEMMADLYNQDAYSRKIAQEAIERYNTHIERCNRAIEAAEHGDNVSRIGSEIEQLKGELACVASERDTATRERDVAREELRKKSDILADMSVRLEALTGKSGATTSKPTPGVPGADPRLVTHINNLQEQLYAERTNNRRLKGG